MSEKRSPFKSSPKKYHPNGLTILYEDHDIVVVDKINGLLVVGTDREMEKTAHFLLNDYVKKGNPKSKKRVYIVHRLDRETSGILVFAKDEKAKRYLQEKWEAFDKIYFAVVHGKLQEKEGSISSYLLENKAYRMYSTDDSEKGKLSKTSYKVIKESGNYSLLEINLLTGRKHQIRVHFSEKGHPVVGDRIYGKGDKGIKRLALHAASLTISHPFTQDKMIFETELPKYFRTLMNN
ncbi:MAG: RNA pseudouridine synthase [Bacteroidetes bacterium]|nr:RNA pseudouridine synthase [Bacteroidota bacterium]MDA1122255.1 RNA pseudouridine synthase [Bacteroidota bacterium]